MFYWSAHHILSARNPDPDILLELRRPQGVAKKLYTLVTGWCTYYFLFSCFFFEGNMQGLVFQRKMEIEICIIFNIRIVLMKGFEAWIETMVIDTTNKWDIMTTGQVDSYHLLGLRLDQSWWILVVSTENVTHTQAAQTDFPAAGKHNYNRLSDDQQFPAGMIKTYKNTRTAPKTSRKTSWGKRLDRNVCW